MNMLDASSYDANVFCLDDARICLIRGSYEGSVVLSGCCRKCLVRRSHDGIVFGLGDA